MRAGKLRHRITVQYSEQSQDPETGTISLEWLSYCTVWADVSDLSTKDRLQAQAIQNTLQSRAKVRYSSVTKNITSDMRVLFDGYYYKINGTPTHDLKTRREYLTIELSTGEKAWNQ